MKTVLRAMLAVSLAGFCHMAAADHHEKAPDTYIYATYFYCDVLGEDAADETVKRRQAKVYKKAMNDGLTTGWGYLKHLAGGKWRRVMYHMGPSVSAVLSASDTMGERIDKVSKDEDDAFPRSCRAHDDYIWKQASGNVTGRRGKVGLSVYFKCDISREERADEIVATVFAPVYDKHLGKGKLTSWGWATHIVGGSYRRLLTLGAEDVDTLMASRAAILEVDPPEGEEFSKICGSHSDYLWTIDMEGRK